LSLFRVFYFSNQIASLRNELGAFLFQVLRLLQNLFCFYEHQCIVCKLCTDILPHYFQQITFLPLLRFSLHTTVVHEIYLALHQYFPSLHQLFEKSHFELQVLQMKLWRRLVHAQTLQKQLSATKHITFQIKFRINSYAPNFNFLWHLL
jgi:hypothetical protein